KQLRVYFRYLLPTIPASDAYDVYAFFDQANYKSVNSQIWYDRATWPKLVYASYDYHLAGNPWFTVPKATHQPFMTEPFFDTGGSNVSMVSMVAPIVRGGHFLGIAGMDLQLTTLSKVIGALHFAAQGGQAKNSYAFIFSKQGSLITYPDPSVLPSAAGNGQTLRQIAGGRFTALANSASGTPIRVTLPNHQSALVFTQPVPSAGWTLALVAPESAIFAPLDTLRTQAILATLAGLLIMALVVLLLSNGIVGPITALKRAAARLAVGDLEVESLLPAVSDNEIGQLSTSFRAMVEHQREMTDTAERIASGDLSQSVSPKSEADALGLAFAGMTEQLRALVSQVTETADRVAESSTHLANNSEQIGEAGTQVARAIEEVARCNTNHSRETAAVLHQMHDLDNAVAEVASGTQEQARAMAQTEQAVVDLDSALAVSTQRVDAVIGAASLAATTAHDGGAAVVETIKSISDVREAVLKSAEQITALGKSSGEVGTIVKAIDDIASQTNLLALNAAIEAARAGEHGKGFTVVAAEVRKLAERTSSETKAISARIAAIQQQIALVVEAMKAGSAKVEQSAALGEQARGALTSIMRVVEETTAQAKAITEVSERMASSVQAVRASAGLVAAVTTRTSKAAETMRGGVAQVGAAIESIAAGSEQSAAGAEQVSASSQEQTVGAQELATNARELADLAEQLREAIGQFVVDEEPEFEGPAQARRGSAARSAQAA
ncbi:MAG TPA: methyl-accepting chemotaxis protein, partial [Chloroflexota bacterium]|nr:methyl-accepting chemotaxis protein [Chloroflexota bacterium]